MDTNNTNVENTQQTGKGVETPKTFDDILSDKEYQSEFDKRVSKAIDTAKSKWENDAKTKQSEAEKLAKMDAEEKHKYELDKKESERQSAIAELNAYKLKDQATKMAREKGMDISLIEIFDYSKETAETIKTKIEDVDNAFKKAVEKGINEKLKEKSPKFVSGDNLTTKKTISRASF